LSAGPSGLAPWCLVALGGAGGASLRYAVARLGAWLLPTAAFPWPTLLVNALGCFLIGWWSPALARAHAPEAWRQLLVVGLLGGFTTFSAFSYETLELWRGGGHARAAAYVAASLVLCLAGTAAGLLLGRP